MEIGYIIVGTFLALIVMLLVVAIVSHWTDDGSDPRITLRDPAPPVCGTNLPPNVTTVGQLLRTELDDQYRAQVARQLDESAPRPDRKERITTLLRANTTDNAK
jgi:hypothetical protein